MSIILDFQGNRVSSQRDFWARPKCSNPFILRTHGTVNNLENMDLDGIFEFITLEIRFLIIFETCVQELSLCCAMYPTTFFKYSVCSPTFLYTTLLIERKMCIDFHVARPWDPRVDLSRYQTFTDSNKGQVRHYQS